MKTLIVSSLALALLTAGCVSSEPPVRPQVIDANAPQQSLQANSAAAMRQGTPASDPLFAPAKPAASDLKAPAIPVLHEPQTAPAPAAQNTGTESVIAQRPESVGAALPDYASGSKLAAASCSQSLDAKARAAAQALSASLVPALSNEQGQIYGAPTAIDDQYADCVSDLSGAVMNGLQGSQLETVTVPALGGASQNAGSAQLIPQLIRQSKALNIPYFALSTLTASGSKAVLALRIVRVSDGVTVAQGSKTLK